MNTTAFTRLLRPAAAVLILLVSSACASEAGAQWTFAPVADASAGASPGASGEPGLAGAPAPSGLPAASPDGTTAPPSGPAPQATAAASASTAEARVIELEATGALQFTQDGEQLTDIPVTPGETVLFRVENTAGFDHNFYIGQDEELSVPNATTDVGIPTWQSGIQELTWAMPADITGLKFGCTVPGHYAMMQGTFSVQA